MKSKLGNDLNLGSITGGKSSLIFSRTDRSKHLYACGSTGTDKSKFLEHLIRQDIMAWSKSKCGLLLLDPHGDLYDNLIRWAAKLKLDRPIIPIDLRQGDWGKASLDLGAALEKGAIILVNLAAETGAISRTNAERFATGLLNDLWTAARGRGKHDDVKPFYIYLDEFHRFVTPTIAEYLDQARGFGLHLTLVHQAPSQLHTRGDHGKRGYDSVMENASSKIVFRLNAKEDRDSLAELLFMGVMKPEEIKNALSSKDFMKCVEELKGITGESTTKGRSRGAASGNESWFESTTISESYGSTFVPVLGKELSHVQFRSLEEQLFRALAVLVDQQQRHAVARLVGMSAPVSIATPAVDHVPISKELTKRYLKKLHQKLPSTIRGGKTPQKLKETSLKPTRAVRRVKGKKTVKKTR